MSLFGQEQKNRVPHTKVDKKVTFKALLALAAEDDKKKFARWFRTGSIRLELYAARMDRRIDRPTV